MEHAYLYLGFTDDETMIKIGQTTQTCWSRCKKSDYTIYTAIDLSNYNIRNCFFKLDYFENLMVHYYHREYSLAKGSEYFKRPNNESIEIIAEK